MIPGVILAAGASTRMGRPKATLPVDETGVTFLSRIASTLQSAGVDDVLVVVSPGAARDLGDLGTLRVVVNPQPERGQLGSLITALDVVDRPGVRAMLVTLVDLPLVSVTTVRAVLDEYRRSGALIVRPARGDRHGHPVLFDRRIFRELRLASPEEGAKPVIRAHVTDVVNVEVEDDGAFRDIDTPEDYREAIGPLPDA